jgi:preprotein translocase subunit SecD
MTRNNRGKRFAILLDGEIITAPTINEPILSGSGVIGGSYNYETAQQLVVLLNAGALPASLTPVEQRTVLASLGQDQIESGQKAVMIGFLAVIVFMIVAYGIFGVFATMALLVNVILIMGGLSGIGATLTLPGIAGIILTIGMAVDANVLIYERIREENKLGRTPANALQAGYERAFSAIMDANVTTFIAAAVLYMLGAGPVRGFAITLGIGIITSVFTAFVFSRLLAVIWLRALKPKALPL